DTGDIVALVENAAAFRLELSSANRALGIANQDAAGRVIHEPAPLPRVAHHEVVVAEVDGENLDLRRIVRQKEAMVDLPELPGLVFRLVPEAKPPGVVRIV